MTAFLSQVLRPLSTDSGELQSEITKSHRNLPHWTKDGSTYWITCRLADSLPQEKLNAWKAERETWVQSHAEPWDEEQWKEYDERFGERLESWLDAGSGECVLRRPDVRAIVEKCLLHFDRQRYDLIDWVIMPNHVHLLLRPKEGQSLSKILQGIKGVSAKECNTLLGRTGKPFWQEESYDHIVRSQAQLDHFIRYIAENPVKAKLKDGEYSKSSPDNPVCDSSAGAQTLEPQTGLSGLRSKLDLLFAYTEREHAFTPAEVAALIAAIDALKVLDPACGSGAFPMGVLHKLVYILGKLDPDNERWKQTQLAKLDSAPMREQLEAAFADNADDYGRKLYLIENCLYGVDIQPIAIQITKLRFFISLVCDQKTNRNKKDNHGIRPLPNLETKFVAANSLIGLPEMDQTLLVDPRVNQIEAEIETLYHSHFSIQRRDQKLAVQRKLKSLRKELGGVLAGSLMSPAKAKHIAEWDPFDQASADFFDPHWMFGRSLAGGVDVVIGNPPYIGQKGHKEIFQEILPTSLGTRFHQRRMDLFYFFFHLALDVLKNGGHCAYITTNYFITATYADKLRLDLKNRAAILKLTNFNELKIFESAAGQHNAVTFFRKGVSANQVAETAVTSKTGSADETILRDIISGDDADTQYRRVKQTDLYEGSQHYIRMVSNEVSDSDPVMAILGNVARCGTPLGDIAQASQGIVTGCDKVSPKHLATYHIKAYKGDGIFVLTKDELKNLALTPNELRYIRPWFKNSDVNRFYCARDVDTRLIYRSSKHGDEAIPNIKKHLSRFKEILINRNVRAGSVSVAEYDGFVEGQRSIDYVMIASAMKRGDYFCISYARDEEMFDGPKIVSPQRSYRNTFGYNEVPWYASADVYYITNPKLTVALKFILALLNSKVFFAWLYYKGKRKGEMMELYQKPLSEIPIKVVSHQAQKPFVALVDKILAAKQRDVDADTRALEDEIDKLVYALYGLTSAEIKHVENALPKPRNQTSDDDDDDSE